MTVFLWVVIVVMFGEFMGSIICLAQSAGIAKFAQSLRALVWGGLLIWACLIV